MEYDLDAMDMDMLNEARSVLKKRWPQMVEFYLEDAHKYVDNIKNGFVNDDKQAVAINAHPLKSASGGIGVLSIRDIADKIEIDVKNAIDNGGDITHLQDLVPLLDESLSRIEPKLRATIEDEA